MPGNDNNLDTLPKITEELDANVNITAPEYEKEIRRKQSIDTTKGETDILDERRRNWLVELESYEQAIQIIINSLNFKKRTRTATSSKT